jgi:hypothetical protein
LLCGLTICCFAIIVTQLFSNLLWPFNIWTLQHTPHPVTVWNPWFAGLLNVWILFFMLPFSRCSLLSFVTCPFLSQYFLLLHDTCNCQFWLTSYIH